MTLDDKAARFIRELAEAAEAVGAGDASSADVGVEAPAADPELAELADAFNQMLGRIRAQKKELEERDTAFRSALNRLGDALTVTHDRAGIISAVLERHVGGRRLRRVLRRGPGERRAERDVLLRL